MVPVRLVAKRVHRVDGIVDALKHGAQMVQQLFAGLRQSNAAGGAVEKPDAEALFEVSDCLAERRCREAEVLCGPGEAAMLGNGYKGGELSKLRTAHRLTLSGCPPSSGLTALAQAVTPVAGILFGGRYCDAHELLLRMLP